MKRQRRRFARQPPYAWRRRWAKLNAYSVYGHGYYKLDKDGEPVECVSLGEWTRSYESFDKRRVARTELPNGLCVSTVFLGIDHNFGFDLSPPVLFETMIHRVDRRGGFLDYQKRYASRAEALAGHDAAVAWALAQSVLGELSEF